MPRTCSLLPATPVVLALVALLPCCGTDRENTDIKVVNLAQLEATLASHRGKGLLLNLWAMW